MQKQVILAILQRVGADHEFALVWDGGSPQNILKTLQEEGLKVNGEPILGAKVNVQDVVDTKDVQWVIQALGQRTNGATAIASLPPASESSATASLVSSTPGERRTEAELGLDLQRGLVDVIKQIAEGYRYIMWMSNITFILGVTLILMAAISSLMLREDTSSYFLGGLGLAGVVGSLILKPTRDLQNSRANLAQLQTVFINWINDLHNWNRYWELVINQNRGRNQQPPPFEAVSQISDVLINSTRRMMELIAAHCELPHEGGTGNKQDKSNAADQGRQKKDDKLIIGP